LSAAARTSVPPADHSFARAAADNEAARDCCSRSEPVAPGVERAEAFADASPDPGMARRNLARFVAASGSLPSDVPRAVRLFAGSQSMSDAAIRDPDLLGEVMRAPGLPSPRELRERALGLLAASPSDPRPPLRRLVRGETLRVLLADLSAEADLRTVAAALSRIADAAIHGALSAALMEATIRYGTPRDESGGPATITVIAMGKLGGLELNYSSDVDLVFLYSDEGKTDSPDPEMVRRNQDFFVRVVERTRRLLADRTEDGHCYRVDLRLRPEGATGPLARSVAGALAYYRSAGRPWERQALIKARAVAGDLRLGAEEFIDRAAEFVYETPLTIEGIGSIKELKRAMERRNPDPREIKGGPGGIRDVEYVVQFLQLLNGARLPSVRKTGTLPAIEALAAAGVLEPGEAEPLARSYEFLRTLEHRLQTVHEVQTHTMPADREGLEHLALRMGVPSAPDPIGQFLELHAHHSAVAREALKRHFHGLFLATSPDAEILTDLALAPDRHPERVIAWCEARGFADPAGAVETVRALAASGGPRARGFFASLIPHLLLHIVETPDPDRALRNIEALVRAYGAAAAFWQWLAGNPDILAVFVDLCGWSQDLTDRLLRDPAMIDAFLDSLVVDARDGRQPWDDLPLDEIERTDRPEELLSSLKDLSMLRIGIRDIQGKANTRNTAHDLTRLAERILTLALSAARAGIERKAGPFPDGFRFAVLGLGKLGAVEMNYASDLDLQFVAEGGAEHALKLASALARMVGGPGDRGRIYGVDTRVRPWGRSGPLVTPLASFRRYYAEEADHAELLMLTKARFVAGDLSLGRETGVAVADALYGRPPPADLRERVVDMRRRIEESASGEDVKRGFGGLVDVEFIAGYLRLAHGHARPALRVTGTLESLAAARREGLLTARRHEALLTALQFLTTVESRIRIVWDMALDTIPRAPDERERLALRLGYSPSPDRSAGEALLEEYRYHTARTRDVFRELLAGSPST
jgi:glutamate-ammonia-ligase adenylyltransferase